MATTDEELKAALEADAKAMVARVMASRKAPEETTLSDIEEWVRAAGSEMMEKCTVRLVEASTDRQQVPGPACERCGQEMHYKGRKRRHLVTDTGKVTVERAYYYCESCGRGFFPPG